VGCAVGAALGGGGTYLSQRLSGRKVLWDAVGASALTGCVSGLLLDGALTTATRPLTRIGGTAVREGSNLVPARGVRFTQDSAGSTFKDGRSVFGLGDEMVAAGRAPEGMPPVRIFKRGGNIHSLDNRRLFAGQYADISLPYRWATPVEIAGRNQTHIFEGTSISIRMPGGVGNWGWWQP
jgi:hypothetical protein